jgi:hypothetical protein
MNLSHVWGGGDVHIGFLWGSLRQRDHIENLGINEGIPLKGDGGHELDCAGAGYGQAAGCCEHRDEPVGSIKCRELPD